VNTVLLALALSFMAGIVVLAGGALTVRSRETFKTVGILGGALIGLPCLLIAALVLGIFVNVGGNPQTLVFAFFLLVVVAVPLMAYVGVARRRLEKLGVAQQPAAATERVPALPPDPSRFGRCPNCHAVIDLAAARCPECPATFGPEAAWHVEPLSR
jgi:hypothetical protein